MDKKVFKFYTEYHLVSLLGLKAKNVKELKKGIKQVPESSIYYHTHRFLQQHLYLSPEPPNDFAYWVTNVLNIKELGEILASIDTISFSNLEDLRNEFVNLLENYLEGEGFDRNALPGQEFHFMTCRTFVIPTKYVAHDLKEFKEIIGKISFNSIYYHIFESRLRRKIPGNDFSEWFKMLGLNELSKEILKLDPYTMTSSELRNKIIKVVEKYA